MNLIQITEIQETIVRSSEMNKFKLETSNNLLNFNNNCAQLRSLIR